METIGMGFKTRRKSANNPYPGIIKPGLSEDFHRAVAIAHDPEHLWCYLMSLDDERWNTLESVGALEEYKNLQERAIVAAQSARELEERIKKAIAESRRLESYPAMFLDIAIHEQWRKVAWHFVDAESHHARVSALRPKKENTSPRHMLWGVLDLQLRADGFSTDRIEKIVIESRDAFQEWGEPAPSLRGYDGQRVANRPGSPLRARLDSIRSRFSGALINEVGRTLAREANPPHSMDRGLHARLSEILERTGRDKPAQALDICAAFDERPSLEFSVHSMFGERQHAALIHARRIFAYVIRNEMSPYPGHQFLHLSDRARARRYNNLRKELRNYGFNLAPQERRHIEMSRLGGHAVIARVLTTCGFDRPILEEDDGSLFLPNLQARSWVPIRFLDPSIKKRLKTSRGRHG